MPDRNGGSARGSINGGLKIMDENSQAEDSDCIWCIDSETGDRLLLHTKTGFIIARKDADGNIIYSK